MPSTRHVGVLMDGQFRGFSDIWNVIQSTASVTVCAAIFRGPNFRTFGRPGSIRDNTTSISKENRGSMPAVYLGNYK